MAGVTPEEMRAVLLHVISERGGTHTLQATGVLNEAGRRLKIEDASLEIQQALLTIWGDLIRTGYIAPGYNLSNPDLPFCHVTAKGRRLLATMSRDPANPAGYRAHLARSADLDPVAASYLGEALEAFNTGLHKAAAVMIGAAAEATVLSIRDQLRGRLTDAGQPVPSKLDAWQIKTVLDALESALRARKAAMHSKLFERFEAYWPAFTQQIRAVRNDAGHPTSVDPIDEPAVHAALLIFPEMANLATEISTWIRETEF